MSNERILLILSNTEVAQILERAVLSPVGYQVTFVSEQKSAENILLGNPPDLIIASNKLEGLDFIEQARKLIERYPLIPIILLPEKHSDKLAIDAFRQGFSDYLEPPIRAKDIQNTVDRALKRRRKTEDLIRLATVKGTKDLQQRVNGLEAIQRIGHKVTSTLDLDSILAAVVDAAVELTGAEEGSLLLLDESTGELYVRASRNIQEELVSTLRRGSFPVLGFSQRDLRCSLTCCIIPGYWPHVVTSNMALHGNVVSLEAFVRVMAASLPQARLSARFPQLHPVFEQMMRLVVTRRRGIPYSKEMLELAPGPAPAQAA